MQIKDEILHGKEPFSTYGLGTSLLAMPLFLAARLTPVYGRWAISLFNPLITALSTSLANLFACRLGFLVAQD